MNGIDLGYLGKGKDHELSIDKKVSMMFSILFGERKDGRLMVPGLIHKIDGIRGVKKNDKGEEVETKMAMGIADIIPILEHDQGLMAKQVISLCRILKIDPNRLAEFSNDHMANLEYDNEVGKSIKAIVEKEKINEPLAQGDNKNV